MNEFERTLVTKGKVAPELATEARAKVIAHSRLVGIAPLPEAVCRDPDDDAILATALAAQADLLVTGDKELLVLGSYEGISIVTPTECLARLRA